MLTSLNVEMNSVTVGAWDCEDGFVLSVEAQHSAVSRVCCPMLVLIVSCGLCVVSVVGELKICCLFKL